MKDFTFHIPTRIIFGKDAQKQVGHMLKPLGKRVMILYGSDRIRKDGLLDQVEALLKAEDIGVVLCGGVTENPLLSFAVEAVKRAREEKVDCLLAIGGGSVIDTTKAVSIGYFAADDLWDYYRGLKQPERALPLGAILTMAATASEANPCSVLSNEESREKRMLASPLTYPRFALLNPALTYSVPARQTAIGSIDIFAHAFERYFDLTRRDNLRRNLCSAVMRTVCQELPKALAMPDHASARSQLMWAATLAHSDMIGDGGVFACHEISHVLTEEYGLAHGAALSILMPAWCKYMLVPHPGELAEFAGDVWDVRNREGEAAGASAADSHDLQYAQEGILRFQQYLSRVGLPVNFQDAGIRNPDIPHLLGRIFEGRKIIGETFEPMGREDVAGLLEMCRG